MIEYYKRDNGENVKKIEHFSEGCWVNIIDPNLEEIDFLCKKFKLKKENIVDGLDIHESPRFEISEKKVYIYLTAPTEKVLHEYDSSFLIVYSRNQFITISKNYLEIFERILKSKFIHFSELRNLVRILYILSRMFEESIKKIRKEVKTNKAELKRLSNKDVEK